MPNVCAFGFASLFGSSYNSTGWLFFLPFWPYPANFFSSHNINYNIICLVHLIKILLWSGHAICFACKKVLLYKTRGGGYLGSHIDEERSKLRYVMRIATARESLNF